MIAHLGEFLDRPTVLGIGEIGLNKNSRNELTIFREQLELAIRHKQLVLIHTPHLADKVKGTRLTLDLLKELNAPPERSWVDHVEEHTIREVLDAGYWAGLTLYPLTKMSPRRAVDILERYGIRRIMVNSSADWGPSNPFTLFECIMEFRRRNHTEQETLDTFHNNPAHFLGQNRKFDIRPIRVAADVAEAPSTRRS